MNYYILKSKKVSKLDQWIQKHYYKTFGTGVIKNPKVPPSLLLTYLLDFSNKHPVSILREHCWLGVVERGALSEVLKGVLSVFMGVVEVSIMSRIKTHMVIVIYRISFNTKETYKRSHWLKLCAFCYVCA